MSDRTNRRVVVRHLQLILVQSVLALAIIGGGPASAAAGIFGVPTNIGATGVRCTGLDAPPGIGCLAPSVGPPGWFNQRSNSGTVGGETVHQLRLFIEVNAANCAADGADAGTDPDCTLDIKVFDPGASGLHDVAPGCLTALGVGGGTSGGRGTSSVR